MDPWKSQAEFYLGLCQELVRCDPLCITKPKSLSKDLEVLTFRTLNEGLSFLTKTLPKLGKALDQGLASTRFSVPREFNRSHQNRSIPAFMQEYFKRVFDDRGDLLEEADPAAVKHLRQVLFFAYKLEIPYTSTQEQSVINGFLDTEGDLEYAREREVNGISAAASYITRDIFSEFNPKDIVPRHGPGAVATGERLDGKWEFSRLYRSIHQVYPYYDYFIVGGGRELIDRLGWYKSLERLDSGRAKVVLVPKDSRGPRLISCEPLEFQWIQQGLGRKLVCHLESHPRTRGQINFTHQDINAKHALESSLTREYATIDLKDASDRVSLALVREVFSQTPHLLRALEACRTTATTLPDGRVVELKKFAPMGSALCFPIEAYVFWVLLVAAFSRSKRLQPQVVGARVFVYGDDIVLPTEWAHEGIQVLESFALRVNRSKCCITGPFRESCGTDAFKGVKVTPLRLRKLWTGRPGDGTAYVSYINLANSLSQAGYTSCSDMIWAKLECTYGKIPYGTVNASYPCRIVTDPFEAELRNKQLFRSRYSGRYHRTEFFVLRTYVRKVKSFLGGWARLLRDVIMTGGEDPDHIVIPRSMSIKRGWVAI